VVRFHLKVRQSNLDTTECGMARLLTKDGFDWDRVAWTRAERPPRAYASAEELDGGERAEQCHAAGRHAQRQIAHRYFDFMLKAGDIRRQGSPCRDNIRLGGDAIAQRGIERVAVGAGLIVADAGGL